MIASLGKAGLIDRRRVTGTLLDSELAGKTVSIDCARHAGHLIPAGSKRMSKCRLDHRLRSNLARDNAGKTVLSPMVKAADRVVQSVLESDPKRVHRAALSFYNTRCEEMRKSFDRIARLRSPRSAMLVGVGAYSDDLFTGDNYAEGRLSLLKPDEIGLSPMIMKTLGVGCGEIVIVSRYPTTRTIPARVREITDGSDNVVYLPVGRVTLRSESTSITDLLDGDRDGDCYTVRAVSGEKARAELEHAYTRFWSDAVPKPLQREALTWRDHAETPDDPWKSAYGKVMQKTGIGPLTLDWYACFLYLAELKAVRAETELDYEDLRELMTQNLESCFDLKHANGARPMDLHALLLGTKKLEDVRESLEAQGLDMEKIAALARMLHGRSVRTLAQQNPAWAAIQGGADSETVQAFIDTAPAYRPLQFIAALAVAKRRPTALTADLVMHAAKHAKSLAQTYARRLFPTLQI